MSNNEDKEMHESYLRIRAILNAFDTNHGGANRFEVTERRAQECADAEKLINAIKQFYNDPEMQKGLKKMGLINDRHNS